MQTRKHPRTLEEAFGPYARTRIIHPMPEPKTPRKVNPDALVTVVSALLAVWVVCAVVSGWI